MQLARSLPLALLLVALRPDEARAMGLVVGKGGEHAVLSTARVAVATSAARTTWWGQVTVGGASTGFVWIVPVQPGARIDLASDAWLDALDAATSPVVLAPPAATSCNAHVPPDRVPPARTSASTKPAGSGIFADLPTLIRFVEDAGYAIPESFTPALGAALTSGSLLAASTYDASALPTHTLRFVEEAPVSLPFALTSLVAPSAFGDAGGDAAGLEVNVTAFIVAGAAASAGAAPLTVDPGSVLWRSDGTSTYVDARDALIESWNGARWLTESALPDLLFDGALVPGSTALPAVVAQYFTFAGAYGDASGVPWDCTAAAYAAHGSSTPYAVSCTAGALGIAPGGISPCAELGDGVPTPVDPLLCGGSADDAAIAVAALTPADTWVSRLDGIVTAGSGSDVPIAVAAATPSSPVLTASNTGASCIAPQEPAGAPGGGAAGGTPPQDSQSGSDVNPGDAAAAAEGCGMALDSCSSEDSSSDEGGSGGCSKSDDDDDSSGGGCSDDSSSSNGCETARSSSGAAATSHRRRGRNPVSRVLIGLVAAGAIVRRRRSKGGNGRAPTAR